MFKCVRPLAGKTFQKEFRSAGWCKENRDGQKTVAEDSKYGDSDGYTFDDPILILEILSRRFLLRGIYLITGSSKERDLRYLVLVIISKEDREESGDQAKGS
ncbi:hypothetical protein Tco_0931932 [Tanacetum coccineum]